MSDTLMRPSTLGMPGAGHYVSLLRAASCGDIRAAMRSMITQFTKTPLEANEEVEEEEGEKVGHIAVNVVYFNT